MTPRVPPACRRARSPRSAPRPCSPVRRRSSCAGALAAPAAAGRRRRHAARRRSTPGARRPGGRPRRARSGAVADRRLAADARPVRSTAPPATRACRRRSTGRPGRPPRGTSTPPSTRRRTQKLLTATAAPRASLGPTATLTTRSVAGGADGRRRRRRRPLAGRRRRPAADDRRRTGQPARHPPQVRRPTRRAWPTPSWPPGVTRGPGRHRRRRHPLRRRPLRRRLARAATATGRRRRARSARSMVNDGFTGFPTHPDRAVRRAASRGDPPALRAPRPSDAARGAGRRASTAPAARARRRPARPRSPASSRRPSPSSSARCSSTSDNNTAELLIKEIGRRDRARARPRPASQAIQRRRWPQLGFPTDGPRRSIDGSGLDPASRLTCALLADVLDTRRPRLGHRPRACRRRPDRHAPHADARAPPADGQGPRQDRHAQRGHRAWPASSTTADRRRRSPSLIIQNGRQHQPASCGRPLAGPAHELPRGARRRRARPEPLPSDRRSDRTRRPGAAYGGGVPPCRCSRSARAVPGDAPAAARLRAAVPRAGRSDCLDGDARVRRRADRAGERGRRRRRPHRRRHGGPDRRGDASSTTAAGRWPPSGTRRHPGRASGSPTTRTRGPRSRTGPTPTAADARRAVAPVDGAASAGCSPRPPSSGARRRPPPSSSPTTRRRRATRWRRWRPLGPADRQRLLAAAGRRDRLALLTDARSTRRRAAGGQPLRRRRRRRPRRPPRTGRRPDGDPSAASRRRRGHRLADRRDARGRRTPAPAARRTAEGRTWPSPKNVPETLQDLWELLDRLRQAGDGRPAQEPRPRTSGFGAGRLALFALGIVPPGHVRSCASCRPRPAASSTAPGPGCPYLIVTGRARRRHRARPEAHRSRAASARRARATDGSTTR